MRAGERIVGLLGVIETPPLPAIWIVAQRTLGTETPLVMRILMARTARLWRILEALGAMALLARYAGVQANQRKTRDVMIESHLLTPTRFRVTLFAAGPKLAFVYVVFLMAGGAVGGELVAV